MTVIVYLAVMSALSVWLLVSGLYNLPRRRERRRMRKLMRENWRAIAFEDDDVTSGNSWPY